MTEKHILWIPKIVRMSSYFMHFRREYRSLPAANFGKLYIHNARAFSPRLFCGNWATAYARVTRVRLLRATRQLGGRGKSYCRSLAIRIKRCSPGGTETSVRAGID